MYMSDRRVCIEANADIKYKWQKKKKNITNWKVVKRF